MDLVSQGPLRVAPLRFYLSNGGPALTVVCKATFSLRPGESPLAAQQDEPNEDDTYWDDDSQRSLSASTDLVPFKARADVVLVGSAYSPSPARSVVARLSVGSVDKSIEVFADRAFGPDGVLRDGMPFTRMRLRYERAAGGPETSNPVGMRFDAPDARGNIVLPNLQPVGAQLRGRGDTFAPIGFGPIAPGWRDRATKAHRSAPGWSPYGWTDRPLPEGLDSSFFNVAPADQQLDSLQSDETIVLTHLHAEHVRFQTRLQDVMPRAQVERPGAAPQPLALVCDTLSIDTDRGLCHLVWRATLRLSHPAEAGRVVVSLGEPASSGAWESGPSKDEGGDRTIAPMMGQGMSAAMLLPFARKQTLLDSSVRAPASSSSALPFQRDGASRDATPLPHPGPPPPQPPPSMHGSSPHSGPPSQQGPYAQQGPTSESTRLYELPASPYAAPPPPLPQPPPPPLPQPPPPPVAMPQPPMGPVSLPQPVMPGVAMAQPGLPPVGMPPAAMPPPVAPLPQPVPPPRAAMESSPWASPGAVAESAPSRASFGERLLAEPAPLPPSESDRRRGGEPELMGALARPAEAAVPSFLAAAAVAGVVAASNAAADPLPPPRTRAAAGRPAFQRSSSDAVDLLWFDGESVARIRKKTPWRNLLTDLESSAEIDTEEGALGNTPEEIEDRRDVLHVLVHGSAMDDYGIGEALEQAVRADGKVINPLVLTTGQLTFVFDELEMLKATLSAALPFASGDEPLTSATASAKEFLATPGLLATGTVIESLTIRIREAFGRVRRPVANDYLSIQAERALLEKRHYQKREVLSATHLRGLFYPVGAENPIPAYLPEAISKKLPLYQRFSVRMIVEVHRTADQNEVHPAALKALAVGRTLSPAR